MSADHAPLADLSTTAGGNSEVLSLLPPRDRWHAENSMRELVGDREIVLYGAGRGFFTFSRFCLEKLGLRASLVIDRRFGRDETFAGLPACDPETFFHKHGQQHDSAIFITIGDPAVRAEIADRLRTEGCGAVFNAYKVYEYHSHYTAPATLDRAGDFISDHREQIDAAYRLFAHDERSQQIFLAVLRTYLDGIAEIPHSPYDEQYFPADLPLRGDLARFVSCGAFTGDTVEQAHKRFGRMESIACFEPDPASFAELSNYLAAEADELAERIVAFPCGVHRRNQQLRFAGANSTNSSLDPSGSSTVHCVAIDQVLFNFRPTYITMDIEGAELDALAGAQHTLCRHRPELAISAYHQLDHLWSLALFVEELGADYELYLRNYSGMVSETVLYAIQRSAA